MLRRTVILGLVLWAIVDAVLTAAGLFPNVPLAILGYFGSLVASLSFVALYIALCDWIAVKLAQARMWRARRRT